MEKKKQLRSFVRINGAFISIIFVFFLIAGMTTFFSVSISSNSLGNIIVKSDVNKIYLYFFGSENTYFIQKTPEMKDISITKTFFQLMTNIKVNDIRTFLTRELPGFSDFTTKIQVAGKGTNMTTLPIESSPPIDTLLKKKESSQATPGTNSTDNINTNEKKVVYIYHSHSWESFLPLLPKAKTPDDATSTNNSVNVVEVGSLLAADLEAKGIGTDHSLVNAAQALHDKGWTSINAYQYSRGLVQEVMAADPDLKFAIDIHRDSLRRNKTTINIKKRSYARLDFIVGEANPNFKQNLELAKQLHEAIEKKYPGLSRGVFSKDKSMGNGVYNQDLTPRALLVEVGGVDNNLEELQNSMEAFANVFSEYYWQMKGAGQF